jgi:ArsR family transcriptional regulator
MEKIYEFKAEIFKSLSHPIRVKIVEFLAKGEKNVGEIVKHVGAEASNISRHLALLKKSGILAYRKEGLNVYYRLEAPCILNFFNCVSEVLKFRIETDKKLLRGI